MKRILTTLLISHFSFLLLSATPADSLRIQAKQLFERGYYAQSIDLLRNISEDSLTLDDMRLRYDCFCQTGQTDSLIYWGKRVVKRNPMADIIPDLTYRLNNADKEHVNPGLAIEICERYKQQEQTTGCHPHLGKPSVG